MEKYKRVYDVEYLLNYIKKIANDRYDLACFTSLSNTILSLPMYSTRDNIVNARHVFFETRNFFIGARMSVLDKLVNRNDEYCFIEIPRNIDLHEIIAIFIFEGFSAWLETPSKRRITVSLRKEGIYSSSFNPLRFIAANNEYYYRWSDIESILKVFVDFKKKRNYLMGIERDKLLEMLSGFSKMADYTEDKFEIKTVFNFSETLTKPA